MELRFVLEGSETDSEAVAFVLALKTKWGQKKREIKSF